MAISVPSVDLVRNFKPFCHLNFASSRVPSMAVSRRSASVNCSARSVATRCCSSVGEIGENVEVTGKVEEQDFTGTPYIPVYVILPSGTINLECELVDPDDLINQLRILKSINVDGVVVDCWWGIVEAHAPEQYNWKGYRELFQIVRKLNLKLQVVMSFHECGGNAGDDLHIPLPQWVIEVGRENPDIFFTDGEGRRNRECLTWGIDYEWVLKRRQTIQVYYDYMRSFRGEFAEFLEDGVISEIKIGLGPCGELRYPSYPAKHGWKYPGIGQFQCYDKYLMESLEKTAQVRGKPTWGRAPDNAGSYNSKPHETGFFCDQGDYDYSNYGRFFLDWYSQSLIDHANLVLRKAKQCFLRTPLAVKLPGIHWWHHTASHAAELTAGFYNHAKRDGYTGIGSLLRENNRTALNFRFIELQEADYPHEDFPEALTNPDKLFCEVRRASWNGGIPFASENGRLHYDREGYNKIMGNAKPSNDTLGGYLPSFTYLRLGPRILEGRNFVEFERFVRRMHGESVLDLDSSHED